MGNFILRYISCWTDPRNEIDKGESTFVIPRRNYNYGSNEFEDNGRLQLLINKLINKYGSTESINKSGEDFYPKSLTLTEWTGDYDWRIAFSNSKNTVVYIKNGNIVKTFER